MKYKYSAALALLLMGLNFGCSTQGDIDTEAPRPEHVIVIGVDALSPNGIINARTPVMDEIMAQGAYTLNARGVLPTSSSPNWASMVSGSGPEQHGITSNSWERDDHTLPPITMGTEDIYPTIFGVAKDQKPDLVIGAIYTWSGFGRLIERSALSYDTTEENDTLTIEKAVAYIKEIKPDFLFLQLDDVDHVGHHDGHKTEAYYKAVALADEQIGAVIQATKDAGIFNETVFIISADHGGIGYGHGGESVDEIEIPFLVYGKKVKKGHLIKNKIYTYDNAATVAFLLNIEQPNAWIGRPVKSAFEGYPEPKLGNQKVLSASPTIFPKANLYDPAGGLYIDEEPEIKMEAGNGTGIRYTLDGTVPDKNSTLYEGSFKISESAVVKAKSFAGDNQESNVTNAFFRLVKTNSNNGVHYKYYEGDGWMFLPVFETLKPLKKGNKYQFRIDDINNREAQYGIQYTSYLKVDSAGKYRFYLNSDDGSKLYIDDELIVNNDGDHGTIERMGNMDLNAGYHKIKVEYFNQSGGYWLDVLYKGPSIDKQIIPADKLFLTKDSI